MRVAKEINSAKIRIMSSLLSPAQDSQLLTISEASAWATKRLGREVTTSNISYLVNYGRIRKENNGGATLISTAELERYYDSWRGRRENHFKKRLGDGLNWRLSFEECRESDTTKHVHRLHPYKGKFIPQLVEYFLDSHIDEFKTEAVFKPGDIVLDPFCGSGTTLVQSNELGVHAVGADVSRFNTMISNLKLSRVPANQIAHAAATVENSITRDIYGQVSRIFEEDLLEDLRVFNEKYFPSPKFRRAVREGEINEEEYGAKRSEQFLQTYHRLLEKHGMLRFTPSTGSFMDTWYLKPIRSEIESARECIDNLEDLDLQNIMRLILSRVARSARATTHYDLATLIRPVTETYYCGKHGKICKPLFSMLGWWRRYAKDTVARIVRFEKIRTDTMQTCITGDSRKIDFLSEMNKENPELAKLMRRKKIRGIFSSPPYVGLIDYHEQHAYAYEMFGYPRNDDAEIGPMKSGRGRVAREAYAEGIAEVLINCRRFMAPDFDVFLVANDKFDLYPGIAEQANMEVVKEYKRPVLNRAEGDRGAYGESIFHMKARKAQGD